MLAQADEFEVVKEVQVLLKSILDLHQQAQLTSFHPLGILRRLPHPPSKSLHAISPAPLPFKDC